MTPTFAQTRGGCCWRFCVSTRPGRIGAANVTLVLFCLASLTGCPGNTAGPAPGEAALLDSFPSIRGAGATFPSPAYSRWAMLYFEKTGHRLKYVKRGSRGGIAAIKAQEVDFGASDIPLPLEELKVHGLLQFPSLVGGVVPVYHLPGIKPGALRLTADLLASIYLGKVKRWDDAAIRKLNPGLRLPGRQIVPIRQPEASGTSWLFRRYLDQTSPAWRGADKQRLRVGVAAADNSQVVRFVLRFKQTLGYVEFSHAVKHRLAWARLLDRSGKLHSPGRAAFESSMEHGTWSATSPNVTTLAAVSGPGSWPISGATYVLVRRQQADASKASQMLHFFNWALTEGTTAARGLDYATIPARHVKTINRAWALQIRAGGRPVWRGPQ